MPALGRTGNRARALAIPFFLCLPLALAACGGTSDPKEPLPTAAGGAGTAPEDAATAATGTTTGATQTTATTSTTVPASLGTELLHWTPFSGDAVTFEAAAGACAAGGTRLPTVAELLRLRNLPLWRSRDIGALEAWSADREPHPSMSDRWLVSVVDMETGRVRKTPARISTVPGRGSEAAGEALYFACVR